MILVFIIFVVIFILVKSFIELYMLNEIVKGIDTIEDIFMNDTTLNERRRLYGIEPLKEKKYDICETCEHHYNNDIRNCENCNACDMKNGFGCDRYKERRKK